MSELLRSTQFNDEVDSKQITDDYLQDVCKLRDLLNLKVSEMTAWEQAGLYQVEQATLARLNIPSD